MSEAEATLAERERRRHYRVDDRVALRVSRVPASAEQTALAGSRAARERFALVNILAVQREQARPLLRSIERRHGEVAEYMRHLERQIETVARVLGQRGYEAPVAPDREVTLSASGMSFSASNSYPVDTLLELRLTLFPQCTQMLMHARVVRAEEGLDEGIYDVSVEFCDVLEEERELLIKHIHAVQMHSLNPAG